MEMGRSISSIHKNTVRDEYDDNSANKPLLHHDHGAGDGLFHNHNHSNNGRNNEDGNDNNSSKRFIMLDQFRFIPKRDWWGAVANLDLFFTVRNICL